MLKHVSRDYYKEQLHLLYIIQNWTLKEIMATIANNNLFDPKYDNTHDW